MKKLLFILLLLVTASCFGQHNPFRYFYYQVKFTSSDGCEHDQWGKYTVQSKDKSADFDVIFRNLEKYVKPYKIDKKTFQLTGYKQINRKEWLTYKGNKFNPCKPINYSLIFDTSKTFKYTQASSYWFPASIVFFGITGNILTVTQDTGKRYTVSFSPKQVHFINDSTFTFKLNK